MSVCVHVYVCVCICLCVCVYVTNIQHVLPFSVESAIVQLEYIRDSLQLHAQSF